MPLIIDRDDERQRITITITDPWSVEDIATELDRRVAAPVWKYATVYDLRNTAWVPTEADVSWLVKRSQQQVTRHGSRGPVAIVLNEHTHHAMEQYANYGGAYGNVVLRVFHDPSSASDWLLSEQTRD